MKGTRHSEYTQNSETARTVSAEHLVHDSTANVCHTIPSNRRFRHARPSLRPNVAHAAGSRVTGPHRGRFAGIHSRPLPAAMLGDDEDVFDSVTWEAPNPPAHTPAPPSGLSGGFGAGFDDDAAAGPGFRQSTDDDGRDPHEPKWEGYLKTAVRDPTKELAETKDAYVSYLVAAEVSTRVRIG
jgi:hypothetical protein